jgi:hypothetical protein
MTSEPISEDTPQPSGKCCLLKTRFERFKGHLYYVGTTEDGFLTLMQTETGSGRKKKQDTPVA